MKLKDDFFRITDSRPTAAGGLGSAAGEAAGLATAADHTVELNPEHMIYRAHFPGNPITPGVCIIHIVKELSEGMLGHRLLLKAVNNIKFLSVIDPLKDRQVTFSVTISPEEAGAHKVGAVVHNGTGQFAKLSMSFINR